MGRHVASLVPHVPSTTTTTTATTTAEDDESNKMEFTKWEFYEKDSYEISWDVIGRAKHNNHHGAKFVYLGRKTKPGVSVVKGSVFEMRRVLRFLEQALDEIHSNPAKENIMINEFLIPMLRTREGAKDIITSDNKPTFFDDAQVKSHSVQAKLVYDEVIEEYMLYLRSPVTADIMRRLKWIGPYHTFREEDMKRLEAFLKHVTTPDKTLVE